MWLQVEFRIRKDMAEKVRGEPADRSRRYVAACTQENHPKMIGSASVTGDSSEDSRRTWGVGRRS